MHTCTGTVSPWFCQELWNRWCWRHVPAISKWHFHSLLLGSWSSWVAPELSSSCESCSLVKPLLVQLVTLCILGVVRTMRLLPGLWRNTGIPSALAGQAVLLLGGSWMLVEQHPPGLHRKPVHLYAWLCVRCLWLHSPWSQPGWIRALSVVSVQLKISLLESPRKWFKWACVCRKGPPFQLPSLSGVPLNCRHFRREGWVEGV